MESSLFKRAVAVSAFLLSVTAWGQPAGPRQPDPADPHHGETKANAPGFRPAATTLGRADRDFVIDAAIASIAKIELGKLALEKAVSRGVKDFGERLVTDHQKANRELERAVAPYAVMLPTQVDLEHQRTFEALKAKKGADFDAAFIKHLAERHQAAIRLFTQEAKSGEAAALRDFATATLPVLEEHLKIARELAKTKTSSR